MKKKGFVDKLNYCEYTVILLLLLSVIPFMFFLEYIHSVRVEVPYYQQKYHFETKTGYLSGCELKPLDRWINCGVYEMILSGKNNTIGD